MHRRHRIGFCSWSVRPRTPADLLLTARKLAIDAIQLDLRPLVDAQPAWAGAVAELRNEGLTILSGMMAAIGEDYSTLDSIARTGGLRLDETWPENQRRFERAANIAAENELRLVTFHAGFLPEDRDESQRRRMLERLREVAGFFDAANVAIALETGQETAQTLLEVFEELDCPNVGVNFDPANMVLYGKGDPVESLRRLAPLVKQIHIKDAVATQEPGTWGRETPVGRGEVDWPAFFDIACAIDPPVDFVIEREAGVDRLDDIRAASELVQEHLNRCATVK